MKVLITGGAGLVGTVLARHLGTRHRLSCLDRRPAPDLPSTIADLSNLDTLVAAFTDQDAVIHLAADPSDKADWPSVLPNNLVGAYHVFEAARRAGVSRVVFASSNHASGGFYGVEPWRSVVEGRLADVPAGYPLIDESSPIRPDGLYGVSKAFGEAVGSTYADLHGLTSIHLRIGWIRADDDPRATPLASALWLSQRDAAGIVELALQTSTRYGVYYATSDNAYKVFSIARARRELGYAPQDQAPPFGK